MYYRFLCINENKLPNTGNRFYDTNKILEKLGIKMSLTFRRFPTTYDSYLVFWKGAEETFFSRINSRYLDAFYFYDRGMTQNIITGVECSLEMLELPSWKIAKTVLPDLVKYGYVKDFNVD